MAFFGWWIRTSRILQPAPMNWHLYCMFRWHDSNAGIMYDSERVLGHSCHLENWTHQGTQKINCRIFHIDLQLSHNCCTSNKGNTYVLISSHRLLQSTSTRLRTITNTRNNNRKIDVLDQGPGLTARSTEAGHFQERWNRNSEPRSRSFQRELDSEPEAPEADHFQRNWIRSSKPPSPGSDHFQRK